MRQLRVEFARFRSRRAVVLLVLLGALLAAGLAGQIAWDTRPATRAEVATAQAQASLEAESDEVVATISDCEKDPSVYLPPGSTRADCTKLLAPTADSMLERSPIDLAKVLQGHGTKLAVLLLGLLVIAGATYAGADWSTDSISNQLLFSPRRGRVWSAKAIAVVLGSLIASAVILGLFWAGLAALADSRGVATSDHVLTQIGWHYLRAVGLCVAGALGGFALNVLFRSTVATLGLLFAYAAGGEIITSLLPVEGAARWSIGNNIFGWLKPGFRYFDPSVGCQPFHDCNALKTLGHLDAGLMLAVLLLLAVVFSVVSFARRDV